MSGSAARVAVARARWTLDIGVHRRLWRLGAERARSLRTLSPLGTRGRQRAVTTIPPYINNQNETTNMACGCVQTYRVHWIRHTQLISPGPATIPAMLAEQNPLRHPVRGACAPLLLRSDLWVRVSYEPLSAVGLALHVRYDTGISRRLLERRGGE